jgi:hypothetical protein
MFHVKHFGKVLGTAKTSRRVGSLELQSRNGLSARLPDRFGGEKSVCVDFAQPAHYLASMQASAVEFHL